MKPANEYLVNPSFWRLYVMDSIRASVVPEVSPEV
jgi:hypothetical protein